MRKLYFLLLLSTVGFNLPAYATEDDRLYFSIGYYDVFDDEDGIDFRAEYRSAHDYFDIGIKPFAGIEVTSDASIWAGGGLYYDWAVAPQWFVTPSFGVGLYEEGDSDKDLDHVIEFRSQLEVSYEFENAERIGTGISHISNAGLSDDNQGVEIVNISYSTPF